MTGGLIQLILKGIEDNFLTNNPEITFFKTVFRRHTNFSIETREQLFNSSLMFGGRSMCKINKEGDLISNMIIKIELPSLNISNKLASIYSNNNICVKEVCDCFCDKCNKCNKNKLPHFSWCNAIGHVIIDYVEIEIGGQIIDKHYGEWFEIWTELTQPHEKRQGYWEMIGKKDPTNFNYNSFSDSLTLYVPLNFWFCRNIGLALPLIGLYYTDVNVYVKWKDFDDLYISNLGSTNVKPLVKPMFNATVLTDFVYLDFDERFKFGKNSQLYLIEQLQFNNGSSFSRGITNPTIDLHFNHPIKEIIWTIQRNDICEKSLDNDFDFNYGNDWFNYSIYKSRLNNTITDTFKVFKLQLNGNDRMISRGASYFRLVQPYLYHTRVPTNYIYVYSFGLKPEEAQPTGTCNFSLLDNIRLYFEMNKLRQTDYTIKVWAINYNVLLFCSGLAGLAFS